MVVQIFWRVSFKSDFSAKSSFYCSFWIILLWDYDTIMFVIWQISVWSNQSKNVKTRILRKKHSTSCTLNRKIGRDIKRVQHGHFDWTISEKSYYVVSSSSVKLFSPSVQVDEMAAGAQVRQVSTDREDLVQEASVTTTSTSEALAPEAAVHHQAESVSSDKDSELDTDGRQEEPDSGAQEPLVQVR